MASNTENSGLLDLTQEKDRRKDEMLRQEIIIWLGTTRPDGRPHMVPVWFLWEAETGSVLVFSKPDVKVNNLKHNNKVSLGISDPTGHEVVLLEGEATLLAPTETTTAYAPYVEKYAHQLEQMGWTAETMAQSYSQPIRIKVNKIL